MTDELSASADELYEAARYAGVLLMELHNEVSLEREAEVEHAINLEATAMARHNYATQEMAATPYFPRITDTDKEDPDLEVGYRIPHERTPPDHAMAMCFSERYPFGHVHAVPLAELRPITRGLLRHYVERLQPAPPSNQEG